MFAGHEVVIMDTPGHTRGEPNIFFFLVCLCSSVFMCSILICFRKIIYESVIHQESILIFFWTATWFSCC